MNYIVTNEKKLSNIFQEISSELKKGVQSINLSWEKSSRPKTLSQLGFFFGGLVKAINKYYFDNFGKEYEPDLIKEMLYNECSQIEEFVCPNGEVLYQHKRISRMTVQEMSDFIEKVIDFCDEYEIVLQPELRYLWVHNLNPKEVDEVEQTKFPEKDPEYLSAVHRETCLICGKSGVEAHHTKLPELAGLGDKTPDWCAIPLCSECHRYFDGDGHIGTNKIISLCPFIFKHIKMKPFLKMRYKRWREHL